MFKRTTWWITFLVIFGSPCLRRGMRRWWRRGRVLYALDGKSRLLDQLREQIRVEQYSIGGEYVHVKWAADFVRCHALRQPLALLGRGRFIPLSGPAGRSSVGLVRRPWTIKKGRMRGPVC